MGLTGVNITSIKDMETLFARGARGYMQWAFMAGNADNGDGDKDRGMDRRFHTDWDTLFDAYRQRAAQL